MATARSYMASQIRELRKARGLNTDQLGALIGKSGKTVQAWERGLGQPDADKLIELCHTLGVDVADFYETDLASRQPRPDTDACSFPVLGSIAAGLPLEAIQINGERYWAPTNIVEAHPHAFFLRVNGDSMNLKYPDGCLVLIDPDDCEIRNGMVYAVFVNQDDVTLKQVFRVGHGIVLNPMSSNASHRVITIAQDDPFADALRVLGRAVWFVGIEE